jgi:tRNA-dihydrouridine synthase
MIDFWQGLPAGFLVLAPMEDVTDTVFRRVVKSCGLQNGLVGRAGGVPDVFFTEFTNCDGMMSVGQARVIHRLRKTESERPIVAQIWGKTVENYEQTAKLILEMGFDGIDINMGCPEKSVVKQGACSALIKNPKLALEIIEAVKRGSQGKLPISVKTRIGFGEVVTEQWCGLLLDAGIQALSVHGRTAKQMSDGLADWGEIAKVVAMRDAKGLTTKIIGNGDVSDWQDAAKKVTQYGVDGCMIGRGVFRNPYCFNPEVVQDNEGKLWRNGVEILPREKLELLLFHTRLWCETWKVDDDSDDYYRANKTEHKYQKNMSILKKFYKIYCNGFPGAVDLRVKLMETEDLGDVEKVIKDYESKQ